MMVSPHMEGLLALIACPCGGDLRAEGQDAFVCERCGRRIHHQDGVLLNDTQEHSAEEQLKRAEEAIRDKQAPLYDLVFGTSMPGAIETRWAHKRIATYSRGVALDVGCGTGRMTLALARANKRVVAVDRSLVSLLRCRDKLQRENLADRVLLVKSDINAMPLKGSAFDLAVSTQVIQHLPSSELREQCVACVGRAVKPGGAFLVSVYLWNESQNFQRSKVGAHKGGISYFRFTVPELNTLLAPHFDVNQQQSCLGKLLFTVGVRRGA